MLQGTIIRGTTPIHEFDLFYPMELIEDVRITYGQNKKNTITKTKEDMSLENSIASVVLSQEETYMFRPGKNVYVEIRIKLIDGQVVRNEDPIILRMLDTLDEEVMK